MQIGRKMAAALLLAAAGLLPQMAQSAGPPPFKVANGKIDYKLSGPLSGTMSMIWISGGRKIRQDIKGKLQVSAAGGGAQGMPINTWVIYDGAHLFTSHPMMANTALRIKPGEGSSPVSGGSAVQLGKPIKGKVVGKGVVLGRSCSIMKNEQGKTWVWNSLPLKFQAAPAGRGGMPAPEMVATQVSTTFMAPTSKFSVPRGYTIQDMTAPPGRPGLPSGAQPR